MLLSRQEVVLTPAALPALQIVAPRSFAEPDKVLPVEPILQQISNWFQRFEAARAPARTSESSWPQKCQTLAAPPAASPDVIAAQASSSAHVQVLLSRSAATTAIAMQDAEC